MHELSKGKIRMIGNELIGELQSIAGFALTDQLVNLQQASFCLQPIGARSCSLTRGCSILLALLLLSLGGSGDEQRESQQDADGD